MGRIDKAYKKRKGRLLGVSFRTHSTTTLEGSYSQTTVSSDKSFPPEFGKSSVNSGGVSRLLPFSSYVSGVSS